METITHINVMSPEFKANPFPFYARQRAEGPVCRVALPGKLTAWLVMRYDDVLMVLKDDRFAKDRRNALSPEQMGRQPWMPGVFKPLAHNMLDLDEPDHTRLRALVHKAFTPRLIEQMRVRIQTLSDELLDAAERRGRMDLIRDYALPIPTTIIAEMLGVPAQDRHKFTRWSKALMSNSGVGWSMVTVIPHALAFLNYIRKTVKDRRANPRDDLVTALVQAREGDEQLSEDELLAMIFLLLVAGHETTVNLIGNGTLALLEHPEQLERLRNDPELIKPAVEELVRYSPPVEWGTERYTREPVTIDGVTIPAGELVFAVIASAHRDERQFANPDTLDLTRQPNRHLGFGQGIHYCLGAPLARMEGQIAISTLLARRPDLRLAVAPGALRWRRGLILRGLESMPVAFTAQRAAA